MVREVLGKLFVIGGLADDNLVAVVSIFSVLTLVVVGGWIKEGGASEYLALLRAFFIACSVSAYVMLFFMGIYTA